MSRVQSAVSVFVVVSGLGGAQLRAQTAFAQLKAASQARAEARAEERVERDRLAEAIIAQRESVAGAIGASVRSYLKQQLREQPLDALRAGDPTLLNAVWSTRHLSLTPVAPCRLLDTRSSAGGVLVPGARQAFKATGETADLTSQGGSATGCGVPAGATSVAVNFGATQSAGPGNVRAYAWGPSATAPTASTVNFGNLAPAGLATMPNGAIVPLCDPYVGTCTSDLYLETFVSNTHLVADVTGYFTRTSVTQGASWNDATVVVPADGTCTNYASGGSSWGISVFAPVAGRIVISGIVQFYVDHVGGQPGIYYAAVISDTATSCPAIWGFDNYDYLPASAGTGPYQPLVPVQKVIDVPAGVHTFYLNGFAVPDAGTTDTVGLWYASLTSSFQAN